MSLYLVPIFFVVMIILTAIAQPCLALYFGNDTIVTNQKQMPSHSLALSPYQLKATENGDLYIGWIDKNAINIASKHENQSKFDLQLQLSQNSTLGSFLQIAATKKGDVYVVWTDINNKTGDSNMEFIYSNDSGKTFGPEKQLSDGKSISFCPQLAVSEKGDVYVVWVDVNNKTGNSDIEFISSNDSGKTFGPEKQLSGGKSISSSPQLAVSEKGDVHVVWVDVNNKTGNSDIEFISSNDSGKTFGPKEELRRGNTLSFSPQIAATENGDVHVVWVDKSVKTGDTDINFRSSHDDGKTFDDRKRLRSNNLLSFSPQLAATERGELYVVWTDKNSTTAESQISFRASHNDGKTFDRVINLNKDHSNLLNSSSPQLAAAGNSTVYVVWVDEQIQFKEILVNDAIVGNPISLSNKTTSSLSPQVAVADNGKAYVLWIDKSSTMDRSIHFKKISQYLFDRIS
jgi:hypothetical protein